jgi:hypothetical protein
LLIFTLRRKFKTKIGLQTVEIKASGTILCEIFIFKRQPLAHRWHDKKKSFKNAQNGPVDEP